MSDFEEFGIQRSENIERISNDKKLQKAGLDLTIAAAKYDYSFNFDWLGIPIIQHPQDMVATQELIWSVKPDVIIETGIARGGSLILSASILQLIGKGKVIGVDIDLRDHNRKAIESHPLFHRIELIQGSSVDNEIISLVMSHIANGDSVMVFLDSNHTHEHVAEELRRYSPMVTKNSYLVVFDTVIEDMPDSVFDNRPWGVGNSPKTAVLDFLKENDHFEIQSHIDNKLLVTVAPSGYLKRVK
jgi:cephalosporin hydroxylase